MPEIIQLTEPSHVSPELRAGIVRCWIDVTNSGGAVGFPFPPVDESHVDPTADDLIDGLHADTSRLLVALAADRVVGWVRLSTQLAPLIAHWGTVHHLQSHPDVRGTGVGSALLRALCAVARDELGLAQLRLAVRGGAGLEPFYLRHGWREIGRWPNALRLAADDYRDDVLMLLDPL